MRASIETVGMLLAIFEAKRELLVDRSYLVAQLNYFLYRPQWGCRKGKGTGHFHHLPLPLPANLMLHWNLCHLLVYWSRQMFDLNFTDFFNFLESFPVREEPLFLNSFFWILCRIQNLIHLLLVQFHLSVILQKREEYFMASPIIPIIYFFFDLFDCCWVSLLGSDLGGKSRVQEGQTWAGTDLE